MPDDSDQPSPEELRELLRRMMSGETGPETDELAKAMGLPGGAKDLERLMSQLRGAAAQADGTVDWSIATEQAVSSAGAADATLTDAERTQVERAFQVAGLWVDEATVFGPLTEAPGAMTRTQWIRATMPFWTQLAEPVASSIADALTRVFQEQAPPELLGQLANTGPMLRTVCGTIFAAQLGQVVGQLAGEVVSGGDVGIPLLAEQRAALLPQNLQTFGEGLEVDAEQIALYLAIRELAHARLFRHARWLRLGLTSAIGDFARELRIDMDRVQEFAADFDPTDADRLRDALSNGALIPPKTAAQEAALTRLETTLALVEGWVDVVTADAAARLPKAEAIAEIVRRRRATGGPAEQAFGSLVGLELRPRRLREAAALWRRVTDSAGLEARDALWSHPDLVPASADLDDPDAFVARLVAGNSGLDAADRELDAALQDLLRGGDGSGSASSEGQGEGTGEGDQPTPPPV